MQVALTVLLARRRRALRPQSAAGPAQDAGFDRRTSLSWPPTPTPRATRMRGSRRFTQTRSGWAHTRRRVCQPVADAADQRRGRIVDAERRRRRRGGEPGDRSVGVFQRGVTCLLPDHRPQPAERPRIHRSRQRGRCSGRRHQSHARGAAFLRQNWRRSDRPPPDDGAGRTPEGARDRRRRRGFEVSAAAGNAARHRVSANRAAGSGHHPRRGGACGGPCRRAGRGDSRTDSSDRSVGAGPHRKHRRPHRRRRSSRNV